MLSLAICYLLARRKQTLLTLLGIFLVQLRMWQFPVLCWVFDII